MDKGELRKHGWSKKVVKDLRKKGDNSKNTLKEIKKENYNLLQFNLGLIFGLILGLVGNLFIVLLDKIYLQNMLPEKIIVVYHLSLGLVVLFFVLFIYLIKKSLNFNQDLEKSIKQVEVSQEYVEKVAKVMSSENK